MASAVTLISRYSKLGNYAYIDFTHYCVIKNTQMVQPVCFEPNSVTCEPLP